jgi:hypothetical protein
MVSISILGLSSCDSDSCNAVRDELLQPTNAVQSILLPLKNGNDVKAACPTILEQLRDMPNGAQTIRDLAANKFSDSYSNCTDWRTTTRWEYSCSEDAFHAVCEAEPFSFRYCATYEHQSTEEAGYVHAILLSAGIDAAFAKANDMCGQAENGSLDFAYALSRELLNELNSSVIPQTEHVYGAACN